MQAAGTRDQGSEAAERAALTAEAVTWVGTPYHPNGKLKGVGVNCSQFPFRAAKNAGVFAPDVPEPREFTAQLALHSKEERLIEYLLAYGAVEILEAAVQPGDVVVYKNGQSHGHMGIVLCWPEMIHVVRIHGCQLGTVDEGLLGGMGRKYFTFWKAGS